MHSTSTPRIEAVMAIAPRKEVVVRFAGDDADTIINLAGWVATGGEVLKPLADAETFAAARVADFGRAIEWGEEGGDLAIDAVHLQDLAGEQTPFGPADLAAWQERSGVSNTEGAGVLGVARSTFLAYKAGTQPIPSVVAIACRASLRDPMILQAHLRPAPPAGRRRGVFLGHSFLGHAYLGADKAKAGGESSGGG